MKSHQVWNSSLKPKETRKSSINMWYNLPSGTWKGKLEFKKQNEGVLSNEKDHLLINLGRYGPKNGF